MPLGNFNSMLLYVNVFIAVKIEELRVVLTETGVHGGCFPKRLCTLLLCRKVTIYICHIFKTKPVT